MADDDCRGLPKTSRDPNASSLQYGLEDVRDARVAIVVQMMVTGDKTFGEIAAHLDITPRALWNLRAKHNIDELVARIQLENMNAGNAVLRQAYVQAAREMARIISQGADEELRMKAAQYILERVTLSDDLAKKLVEAGYDVSAVPESTLEDVVEATADESGGGS